MEPITIAEYFDVLGKSQKVYARHLEPLCKKWELTRIELDILLFLYNNPGFDRAADVAARRGISKSHVSLAVTSLERRELLLRQTQCSDRREVHLSLTVQGTQIAAQARQVQAAFFSRLYQGIDPEEMARWARTSRKIRENVETLKLELD